MTESDEPDKCPVCGEEYEERHETDEYEKPGPWKGQLEEELGFVCLIEIENRKVAIYSHV